MAFLRENSNICHTLDRMLRRDPFAPTWFSVGRRTVVPAYDHTMFQGPDPIRHFYNTLDTALPRQLTVQQLHLELDALSSCFSPGCDNCDRLRPFLLQSVLSLQFGLIPPGYQVVCVAALASRPIYERMKNVARAQGKIVVVDRFGNVL